MVVAGEIRIFSNNHFTSDSRHFFPDVAPAPHIMEIYIYLTDRYIASTI
jgi:hypothetical protein